MHQLSAVQASEDWKAASAYRQSANSQMSFVPGSTNFSSTDIGGTQIQIVAPQSGDIKTLINKEKLQTQAPHFDCPQWAAIPRKGWYLEVHKGRDMIEHIDIDSTAYFLFGRNASVCDYTLEHPSLSRVHFAIVHHKNGEPFVIDLRSGHGTFLNDEKLEPTQPTKLTPGSSIRAGASTRHYVVVYDPVRQQQFKDLQRQTRMAHQAAPPASSSSSSSSSAVVGTTRSANEDATTKKRQRDDDRPDHTSKHGFWDDGGSSKRQKAPLDSVRCRHILLRHVDVANPVDRHGNEVTRTKAEAKKHIEELRKEILLDLHGLGHEETTRKLAKKESDCSTGKKGGDLGKIKRGTVAKALEDTAFKLEVGQLSDPFETDMGVHILLRTA
eukprot:TRINITY_DN49350_c0_g1_i1.p1 TRINITY_DN49350_c0_g1~~TRINITY_DN49350_c0_g1_i1.p1  ORF type:complete len:384 (+),score=32.54 TRINITY_DN49350_c0_g1_i1:24-1175(+)